MAEQETLEDRERVHARAQRLRWLISLRWVGLGGIALAGVSAQVAGYAQFLWHGWLLLPLALSYNVLFVLWLRGAQRAGWPSDRLERSLHLQSVLQAMCDMLALNLLVYLNGGIECPTVYAPLLAVMLNGLLLGRAELFLQANLGAAILALMALAEYRGWIPHVTWLRPEYQHDLYRDPNAAWSVVLSMSVTLNLVAYLMSGLGQQLNTAEARIMGLLGQLRRQVGETSTRLAGETRSIESGAEEANQVAAQISATVQQIAQGAGQQASQLERLSRNIEHMVDAAMRMAQGTQETHGAAGQAAATAEQGRQAAREANARMEDFARVFAQAGEALENLARHSDEIAEVAAAIDRFAERTDLLALNASIEAAHAGEHGRGFAVVAGEVKKLAASSSASAERVAHVVGQVQVQIADVVQLVQASMERARDGQKTIATLQGVLDGMATVISRTDELAGTMEHLSRQQMDAHREIVRAVEEIASAAEETAAGAEETAAAVEQQAAAFEEFSRAAQNLAGLADQLDRSVASLTQANGDGRARRADGISVMPITGA